MRKLLRNNGLSIVFIGMFLATWLGGQSVTGFYEYNSDAKDHKQPQVTYVEYLATPHFLEATMENWESEFLQMFLFIVLTIFLFQKGSAESKDPDKGSAVDKDPTGKPKKNAPWPVRKGGVALILYRNSLSLVFLICFLASFYLHAVGGAGEYNQDQREHGTTETVSAIGYMGTSRFWFESLQNWQSEFLSVGMMVVLSIWLRQKGSPESKPIDAPNDQTGN